MTNSRAFRPVFPLAILLLSVLFTQAQVNTDRAVLQQASQLKAVQERDIRQMVLSLAAQHGWPLTLKSKTGRLAYLHGLSRTGHPIYVTTNDNVVSAATIRTSSLWPGGSTGLSLNGSSSYLSGLIAVWDEGKVRPTHVELNGRVTQVDGAAELSDHSTHVAGTMIAAGVNPVAKGMSFGALNLKAYDFGNDQSEMMTAAGSNNLLVSNHSYSIIAGWYNDGGQNRWEWWGNHGDSIDVNFGLYDDDARTWDSIAYHAPFYLISKAAGNNRSVTGPKVGETYYYYDDVTKTWKPETRQAGKISNNDGYMIIATYGNAKNILTVGAVNPIPGGYSQPNDVQITDFSSWGPTGDGRIKPDVVADGANVLSSVSSSDNAYDVMSGTSMASPAAAGSSFLLQEYWSKLHGGSGHYMRSATLRGLIIHTADEAGPNPGPDYKYGWGLINMEKAAAVITADNTAKRDQMIVEDALTNTSNNSDTITVVASGLAALTATICWTDPPGVPVTNITSNFRDAGIKIRNDLDVRVIDAVTGVIYQPWVLDPSNPSAAATRGDNVRDNVEKVQVDSLIPGRTYKIAVSHKGTLVQGQPTGSQAYTLLVSGVGGTAYCASGASTASANGSFISNVNLGSLNNSTTTDCNKQYNDLTSVAAPQLPIGQTMPVKVSYRTCSGSANTNLAVYIDYNNDGDFSDAGELAASATGLSSSTTAATFTGSVSVPVTVKAGIFTRMRVIVQDGSGGVPGPCGTYAAGETQDFRVMFSLPSSDVGVANLEAPGIASCASDSQIVSIRIRNYGTTPQNAVPVTTVITNGGTTVATLTATCKDTIPGKSDVVFTYNTTFKAVAGATYTFTSTTSLGSDPNTSNDQNVTNVAVSTGSTSSVSGTATICGASATSAALKATTSGNDLALWYDSPTATTPIAAGNNTSTTVIPSDKTYYLGINELNTKLEPATKNTFAGGAGSYARLGGNFIQLTTSVPLTLESARMYIGHNGQITFTLATLVSWTGNNYSYIPVYNTSIDVYATRTTPSSADQLANDPNDQGGIFKLNIPIPTPGDYILIIDCSDSTSAFLNISSTANIPYPVSIPGVLSITRNDQKSSGADSLTSYKKYWFPFYNLGVRLAGCPGTARTPVVAVTSTAVSPVITLNGNIFTSSYDDGNQWYRSGTLLQDSTNKTLTAIYSGNYQTIVTDPATGCNLPSNTINFVSTGTNDVNASSIGLKVSPNPNDGAFQLEFKMTTQENTSIILLNTLGQRVYEEDLSNFVGSYNKRIQAGDLASGMYVLKIIHGNNSYIRKILVKK